MGNMSHLGDTTLTKVFVGGLAWETQKDTLKDHFNKYGEILEAVIISDNITGRSKGYGFVTFKEPEVAKKACEDPTPVINNRRANCNLASLGAKRARASPPMHIPPPPPPQHHQPQPTRVVMTTLPTASPGRHWFYPSRASQPPPFHQQYHGVPYYAAYGYSPSYMPDMGYNAKLSHSVRGGTYFQGHYFQPPYPRQGGIMSPNGVLPIYPYYQYHNQSTTGMGVPAHIFSPSTARHMTALPTIISKPTVMPPTTVCLPLQQVTGYS